MLPLIQFKEFSFQYQSQAEPTLKDINLDIQQGEKVAIIGPSGSGKSTLGQCLNGLVPHVYRGEIQGQLLFQGQDLLASSIVERSLLISSILQDTDGQFIGQTVAEDVAFALENDALETSVIRDKVAYWLDKLGLTDLAQQRPQDLSGGQKQAVGLGGVLIDESSLLLFDEPLANLDPQAAHESLQLLGRLHEETGSTLVIIEHRLEEVLELGLDRIILMENGQIAFDGNPNQLLASPLLTRAGIREPLYLTVLRELGMELSADQPLDHLATLELPQLSLPEVSPAKSGQEAEVLAQWTNLSFAYPGRPVLFENLNLQLRQGELVALLGKNGTGKSTLAQLLSGYLPAQGQYCWQGQEVTDQSLADRANQVGYVLQNPNQMISQTMIFDEVARGLRLRGLAEAEVAAKVAAVLEICGLTPFRNWPISALSYGQKKRVTIAAILVLEPRVLILDEPTAGQDQAHYREMMDFLQELAGLGHAIVMITHDMQLMLEYADRALVLDQGKIIADQDPRQLLSQPELLTQAHLRTTSLFELAAKLQADPLALSQFYQERRKQA
ncbi:ATP-binding cassette domain-containing protein [Streptococcus danieliae]|uniref:ATP-binding cassette domain-containing protein n=1 Tax=Streptococcus danieliae TaxID=747656 RepID=A0A7X3KCM4_9STRE|nr:ATP-binding cassette domain-containing protein [Streptococcus danieliae]